MDSRITEFLDNERLCALNIVVNDNTLHPATMHFSYTTEPQFVLYFSTDKTTRKTEKIRNGEKANASVLIGFNENSWLTMQMGGEIRTITDEQEVAKAKEVHYQKNPGSKKFEGDPDTVMLVFEPTWWKYSDLKTEPATVIQS